MLDTSAVIGWVERGDQTVIDALAGESQVPFIHVVTLGELEEGVIRAPRGSILRIRAATQGFATNLARIDLSGNIRQPVIFGVISARIGRTLSHNDKWILAAAIEHRHTLVTQDVGFLEAAKFLNRSGGTRHIGGEASVTYCPVTR